MRRLYIGGLSHTVTQKDLKDRFGKFGEVEDVELRTRKDSEGIPYKTFGYLNINISDADLKKCLTVLNKAKWKGGTLQIETAKESFLHRLAEERQAAAGRRLQQPAAEDQRQKTLDSLSRAGVDNFTMKAAVPGTEVPGHKDWVVGKFGRVLPVLQLRCQKGSRIRTMKYDPSKYGHNIRRLDRSGEDQHTPVAHLTWEVPGGDDDISKKRRGEFPPYELWRAKKSRTNAADSHEASGRRRFKPTPDSEDHLPTNGYQQPANHRPAQRRGTMANSDVDSDEEIRRMVAAQDQSQVPQQQEVDEDKLEVVGLDFLVKSGQQLKGGPGEEEENDSADTDELLASRKPPPPPQERLTPPTAECLSRKGPNRKKKTKRKSNTREEEEDSSDGEDDLASRKPCSIRQRRDKERKEEMTVIKPPVPQSADEDEEELGSADCSDSDYDAMFSNVTRLEISLADLQRIAEESQRSSDAAAPSSHNASSGPRPSATSGPAPKRGITPEEILTALMEEDSSEDEQTKKKKKRKVGTSVPLPAFQGTRVQNETGSEAKKQKLDSEDPPVKRTETEKKTSESSEDEEEEDMVAPRDLKVVPAKPGVNAEKAVAGSSSRSHGEEEEEEEEEEMRDSRAILTANVATVTSPSSSSSSPEEDEDERQVASTKDAVKAAPPPAPHSESSSEEEEEEEEEMKDSQTNLTANVASVTSPSSSSSSSEEDEDEQEVAPHSEASSEASEEEEEEGKQAPLWAPLWVPLGPEEEEERQRKANMRRLAAVQQRQTEAAEQKKLIQGALARLDAPTPRAGKHIVFGSDDDDDDEEEDKQQTSSKVTTSKKALFEESQSEEEAPANKKNKLKEKVHLKLSAPQLFGGCEDDEDGDEEEDGSRFDIRPQFEGRAGQKLMELQSRFGTDERFRMDSRFLEEDEDKEEESERKRSAMEEDEALEDERKKNLSILQSVLGSTQQTAAVKTPSKAKTFRDVAALHYDPSRQEHAAFETKPTETKESKSARRKRREEALRLPEVSKEIYYDVTGDLKAVFGQTKDDDSGEEEKACWDQEEEEEGGVTEHQPTPLSSLPSADPCAEEEKSSGFKFSFFGDDTEAGSGETEYKVESIQAPKVSWQQDPRFHDSSSDEDEEELEEDEKESSGVALTRGEAEPSKPDRFFFYAADLRLTDGPRWFCRSSQLEEQREQWEEKRSVLRQEYRKKHKDARRKLKSSHKS